jgi:vancomycin resistance protein VanJ
MLLISPVRKGCFRMLNRFLRLGLGWSYVVLIVLWLVTRSLFSDLVGWIGLLNYLAIYLFIPLPILLAIALWQRWRRLVVGLCIPLLAFYIFYGMLFLPSAPTQVGSPGQPLTVMTFNLRLGNQSEQPIAQIIRAANPDIVGVQEWMPELAKPLMASLIDVYPYQKTVIPELSGVGSVGILSKFPITTSATFPLPGNSAGMNLKTGKEFVAPGERMGLQANIQVNQQTIQVISIDGIHNPTLGRSINQWLSVAQEHYVQKMTEIQRLEHEVRREEKPFLILCDCNLTDSSEAYQKLATFAQDSFRDRGWGLGHTIPVKIGSLSVAAGQRLDYIWHSDEFVTQEAWVGHDAGSSDHFPVLAKLVLKNISRSQSHLGRGK